jgi:hypothetical protein
MPARAKTAQLGTLSRVMRDISLLGSKGSSFFIKALHLHKHHSAHHHHHHVSWVSAVLAAGLFGLLPLDVMKMELLVAHATKGYEATVNQSAVTVDVAKGGQATVILTYKNTGTTTWVKTGTKGYVSAYLVGKTSSPIGCAAWRTGDSPALITDTNIKPGGSTTVKFTVCGKTPGTYTETLRLAAENGRNRAYGARVFLFCAGGRST